MDSLAKLNELNEKTRMVDGDDRKKEKVVTGRELKERGGHKAKKKRIVSGALLEEGRGREQRVQRRGGEGSEDGDRKKRKRIWILIGIFVLLLIILIPVGVVVGKKNKGGGGDAAAASTSAPSNSNLDGKNPDEVPANMKNTYYDPWSWFDTMDYNITYTTATVGGLPIMGLNSTWDDTQAPNSNVPPLNKEFGYGTRPIRGVNVGGWLSMEPFITPSYFQQYSASENVVDEYTLTEALGSSAAQTLEKHYSTFINKQTFIDIKNAGMDHVRIPYSYWAITTYQGDPYVNMTSWRYLLRGIEYCRENGLRVFLDFHGLPGSQNGWNHSGRQGVIGWLNGTDGTLNGNRALDLHKQISAFFAQERYKNVITMYGLVNEPRMVELDVQTVLDWTTNAVSIVRANNFKNTIVFGDGFLGLPNWKGKLQGISGLALDVHQYVIFNVDQIAFTHQNKITFACNGWTAQMQQSQNAESG